MRPVLVALLLVSSAVSSYAEERTWTVSTGSYAMAAELVEVRGDIAYLKTGERIEHIPLARLSAADIQYITSLSPKTILPGPADETAPSQELPATQFQVSELPLVGPIVNEVPPAASTTTQKPVVVAPAPQPQQVQRRAASSHAAAEEVLPVPSSNTQAKQRAATTEPRTLSNTNQRRPANLQGQGQNRSVDQNRSRNDDRRGLFGFRTRRN